MGLKYHLGCGSHYLNEYVNVDFPQSEHTTIRIKADIYGDLLAIDYSSCEEIRSHHVFEHFNFPESIVLLIKWAKALETKGTLRIDIPDIETLFRKFVEASSSDDIIKVFKLIRLIYGSHEADWAYHINGWTPTSLQHVLSQFGLKLMGTRHYGSPDSSFPNCGIDMIFEKTSEIENMENIGKRILEMYAQPEERALLKSYIEQLEKHLC